MCCKKEEAPVVTGCAGVSASIVNDVAAYQTALGKYSTAPTAVNCNAVKSSLTAIMDKIKDCPEFAAMKGQYEAALKMYTCTDAR